MMSYIVFVCGLPAVHEGHRSWRPVAPGGPGYATRACAGKTEDAAKAQVAGQIGGSSRPTTAILFAKGDHGASLMRVTDDIWRRF